MLVQYYCIFIFRFSECYFAGNSSQYTGYVDVTGPNEQCQPWENFKQNPVPLRDSMFPNGSIVSAGSYCRDPLGLSRPFCYKDDKLTECNIPVCTGTQFAKFCKCMAKTLKY